MKNISIIKPDEGKISATVVVTNWSDIMRAFCLKFKLNEGSVTLFQEAEITVKLDDALYAAWHSGGGESLDMVEKADNTFLITSANARLCNLIFEPEQWGVLSVRFNFLTREITTQVNYELHVMQTDEEDDEIVGGEVYSVIKQDRTPFYANAGDDVYVYQDETITLTAEDIGEEALYRWYNQAGNLISEEMDIDVIATDEEQKYKLEIIALSDGYKDYDEVWVKSATTNPNRIEAIQPNPATHAITVTCLLDNITGATGTYLTISNSIGITYDERLLTSVSPQSVDFNVYHYPPGAYTVTLFCNGMPVDTKTFVKH
jgi:hypothetical protein